MSNNLKIPSPWSQLALFMLTLGGALIFYTVAGGLIAQSAGIAGEVGTGAAWDDPRAIGILKWLQALSSVIVFGIPAFCYALLTFRDRPFYRLGLRPATPGNFYLLAILLLLIGLPLEGWLGDLNKMAPLPGWMTQLEKDTDRQVTAFLKVSTPFDIIYNIVIMAALPAFFEELCFRGVLQRILIQIFRSPWAGIVVTGIFFSAFHMQFEGFLPRTFLGILLGAACWYSGSLWTPILAHFFYNGITVIVAMYYPEMVTKNPSVPLYTVLISLVIVVGLLYRMHKQSAVAYAQVYDL
jgi:membrane protease YdiL (CAAX protease family)